MTVASPDCTAHAATTQSAARFLSTPRVLSNGFQRTLDHIRSVDYSEAYKCSLFERLMKMYFINDPLYRERFSNVRLWAEWAGHEPGFDGADTDIDLVAEERQGGYCAIQCKCYAPGTRTSKSPLDLSTARIVADTGDGWRTNAVKTIAPLRPTCDMLRFGDLASQRGGAFLSRCTKERFCNLWTRTGGILTDYWVSHYSYPDIQMQCSKVLQNQGDWRYLSAMLIPGLLQYRDPLSEAAVFGLLLGFGIRQPRLS